MPLPGRRLRGLDVTLTREGGGACRRIDRPARRLTRERQRSRTKTGQYPASSRPACRQKKSKWAVQALLRVHSTPSEGLVLACPADRQGRTRPGCAPIGDKASAEPRILLSATPQRRLSPAGLPDYACCPVASSVMGRSSCGRAHMQSWSHRSTLVTGQGLSEERSRSFPGRPPSPTVVGESMTWRLISRRHAENAQRSVRGTWHHIRHGRRVSDAVAAMPDT